MVWYNKLPLNHSGGISIVSLISHPVVIHPETYTALPQTTTLSELDAAINMTIVRKGNRLLRWMGNMVSCVFDWINWLMVLLPRSWRGSGVEKSSAG